VTLLLVSTQLAQLTERLGFGRVTGIGAMLMSCYPGLLALSRGVQLFLVASVVGGLAWALAGGAINNYILEKVPEQARPTHLAWYNLTLNASILLGSLLGPLLAGHMGLTAALATFALLRVLAALSILRWGG
jgi:MFS family permease